MNRKQLIQLSKSPFADAFRQQAVPESRLKLVVDSPACLGTEPLLISFYAILFRWLISASCAGLWS